jgi:predicted dehydrogenase
MTKPLGDTTIGVACLGVTHPHTSGRVKAVQRRDDLRMLGAADDHPILGVFTDAMGIPARTKREILDDPDVQVVYVHSKSHSMADLTIEALEAGKAVLCEKPAGRNADDVRRIVDAVERTGNPVQVAIAGGSRRPSRRCRKC